MTTATVSRVVDPVAAATYFVEQLGFTAFPVWGSSGGKCFCGDPHDGKSKPGKLSRGPDNIGKHPATERGFKDATADVAKIRTFLANRGTPNYGLNAPLGVMAVDVDGPTDLARWQELQATYGPLPVTLTTTTANGRHYFYRWPDAVGPMPTGKLFGYVVRRHDDGYVIGPGSIHRPRHLRCLEVHGLPLLHGGVPLQRPQIRMGQARPQGAKVHHVSRSRGPGKTDGLRGNLSHGRHQSSASATN